MALKTFISGSKKNLSRRGNAPTTFVSGTKTELVKGVTFVNGEKVVLWDSSLVLTMDVIRLVGTDMKPLWVNDATFYCTGGTNSIREYDITDPENASISNSLQYGNSYVMVAPTEEVDNNVFYVTKSTSDRLPSNQTVYSLVINKVQISDDGTLTIPEANTVYGSRTSRPKGYYERGSKVNGSWQVISFDTPNSINPSAGMWVSLGTTLAYTVGIGSSYSVGEYSYDSHFVKYDDTGVLGTKTNTDVKSSVFLFGNSNVSTFTSGLSGAYNSIMRDDTRVVVGTSATSSLHGSFEIIGVGGEYGIATNKRVYKLVGKIGDEYVVMDVPYDTNSSDQECYLKLFTTTGLLYKTATLPTISGITDMPQAWRNTSVCPIISRTGYLGAIVRDGSNRYLLRIFNG